MKSDHTILWTMADSRCDSNGSSIGSPDGHTMLVTSLCRGEKDLKTDPHAVRVLMFRPGAQGIVEPRLRD